MNQKTILCIPVYVFFIMAYGQNYKEYVPFKQDGLWGIINTKRKVNIKPTYKKCLVIGELDYVQFNSEILIDLSTGEQIPNPGSYIKTVNITNKEYHLFNNKNTSTLINLKEKDTIKLAQRYSNLTTVTVTNAETTTDTTFLLGKLYNGGYLIHTNDAELKKVINDEFSIIDFIENTKTKKIGFVLVKEDTIAIYDGALKLKKSFVSTNIDEYYLLKEKELKQLTPIFKEENLELSCFNCNVPFAVSSFYAKISVVPDVFTVDPKNLRKITVKNKEGETIKVTRDVLFSSHFNDKKRLVQILNFENSAVIIDNRYVTPGKLMFPKKILK